MPLAIPSAVPVPGYWWHANISAPAICPVASYCLGGSRAALPVACGGNMTSAAGSTAEVHCVPLPGFYGVPAQLSPADHYSTGGNRTAEPVACGANLWSLAGSAAITDCGEFCCVCMLACLSCRLSLWHHSWAFGQLMACTCTSCAAVAIPGYELTAVATPSPCPSNYYCVGGRRARTPCGPYMISPPLSPAMSHCGEGCR
jgi:hypothetical protein